MKSRFLKTALMTLATVIAMSSTAFAKVNVYHDAAGRTDVRAEVLNVDNLDRLVLAEFDNYGRMTHLKVGGKGATTLTNTFTPDQHYKTKIMLFSDFESATAIENHRVLGSKTLFIWEGNDGEIDTATGTYDPHNGIANNIGHIVTIGDGMTFKNDGDDWQNTNQNWMHIPATTAESDWSVYEWDMTINSNPASLLNPSTDIVFYINDGDENEAGNVEIGSINFYNKVTLNYEGEYDGSRTLSTGTKVKMSVVVNRVDRDWAIYIDGEWASGGTADGTFPMTAVRFSFEKNYYDITFDNIYVYEGTEPRDVTETEVLREIAIDEAKSLYNETHPGRYDDDAWTSEVGVYKAFHATTGVAYNGREKVMLENIPYTNASGVRMVPKEELETVLGVPSGTTSGQETKNGVVYVPITSFMQGKTYTKGVGASYNDELYVIGTTSFSASDADDLNDAMMYFRPSLDQVRTLYNASDLKGKHPRLIATEEDFDRLRAICNDYLINDFDGDGTQDFAGAKAHWDSSKIYYANDAPILYIRRALTNAKTRGEAGADNHGVPTYSPVNSSDSPRMDYQRYFASDIHLFGFAYQMTGNPMYAEYAWEDIEAILAFPDLNHKHNLDVSEAMAALAIGYDWMYDYWVETGRDDDIERGLHDLGLFPSWAGYTSLISDMGSEFTMDNNHGVVANNGALMLALAMMDVEEEACAWIASQAIKGMELNIDKWHTEMWYEGPDYWDLTMQHTVKFLDSLDKVLGTDFGMSNLQGIPKAANAQLHIHAPRGVYNFGDANRAYLFVPEMMWLDNKFGNGEISHYLGIDITYKLGKDTDQWKNEDFVLAALWYDPEKAWDATVDMELDYVNTDLDVIVSRSSWDWDNFTLFAAKGGADPTVGHAHLDTGSFIFEANGVRWANELGMGVYDDDYFGDNRWLHMTVRGEAHNTIIDNHNTSGADQKRAKADGTLLERTDRGIVATVNMLPALSKASAATRGFFYTDNRQSLVICDEITTNKASTLYWTMMLPSGVVIENNGTNSYKLTYTTGASEEGYADQDAYKPSHTEVLYVDYVVENATVGTITTQSSNFTPIDSTNMLDVGMKNNGKLQIPISASKGDDVRVTVKLTPADENGTKVTGATEVGIYTNGISTWTNILQ